MTLSRLHSTIVGLAVGDDLVVSVEFVSRDVLKQNPLTDILHKGII